MAKDIAFSGAACLSIIFLMAIVSSLAGADIDNIFGGEGRNEGKEWLKVSLVITKTLPNHKIFGSLGIFLFFVFTTYKCVLDSWVGTGGGTF